MSLAEKIREDLKSAMKDRRADALRTLRMVLAGMKNRAIELGRELTDDDVLKLLQTAVKQRKDSIQQFESGGRPELAAQEQEEIDVLAVYLPEKMSSEDLGQVVDAVITELSATSIKEMGAVMKSVLARCAGRADGAAVNTLVRARLAP